MKYCSHCGQQLDDDAAFCAKCGCAIEGSNVRTENYEKYDKFFRHCQSKQT